MVKNIVFDMGNVLVRYDSMKVCRHFMTDEAEMEKVCTSVFVSPEWLMLDMGLITEAAALKRMQKRLPDDHAKEMADCAWSTGMNTVCGKCPAWKNWSVS